MLPKKRNQSQEYLDRLIANGVSLDQMRNAVSRAQHAYRLANSCATVWQSVLESELRQAIENAKLPWRVWYGTALTASEVLVWESSSTSS